jgi:hypothetical protein
VHSDGPFGSLPPIFTQISAPIVPRGFLRVACAARSFHSIVCRKRSLVLTFACGHVAVEGAAADEFGIPSESSFDSLAPTALATLRIFRSPASNRLRLASFAAVAALAAA